MCDVFSYVQLLRTKERILPIIYIRTHIVERYLRCGGTLHASNITNRRVNP